MEDTIHSRIKRMRLRASLSMVQLAAAVGLRAWQAVQQWENGETAPSRARLPKVAQVLGTTTEYLLYGAAAGTAGQEPAHEEPAAHKRKVPISHAVEIAPPAVILDLDSDCLVVWKQLMQLPERDRERWRAQLDIAAANARLNKLDETPAPAESPPGKAPPVKKGKRSA
jgi:transcriptional regulator with XRE-family HTH domain